MQAVRLSIDGVSFPGTVPGRVRATPASIAVMQELRAATSPLTHADLTEMLVPLGFDKATVFRNLNDLADAELISRTELGDHVWRFESLDPQRPAGE